MATMKMWILIIVVLIVLIIGIGYLIRRKSYQTIDELDKKKNSILKHAPYSEIRTVKNMSISGQSDEYRTQLLKQWHEIEKDKYPSIEHYLFNAEQATDRFRFKRALMEQKLAKENLEAIEQEIEALKKLLNDFIRQEEANLKHINEIKSKYHEVRKSLLARSFSFRKAAKELEKRLAEMENDFINFSDLTVSGDHEEANGIIVKLNKKIETMCSQMDLIPQLFQKFDEVYQEQLKEIEQGYHYFLKNGYVFAEDDILKDVAEIKQQIRQLIEQIEVLNFANLEQETANIEHRIDEQYKKMEIELKAKKQVKDLNQRSKQAIYYLKDERKKLEKMANRLSESYLLQHHENQKLNQQLTAIESEEKQYRIVTERLAAKKLPYSEAQTLLERIFNQLQSSYEKLAKLRKDLENYRKRELELKNKQVEMEQSMYEMKRQIENRRLPGIHEKYLELFFSATRRIERLGSLLSQPKLDLKEANKQYEICQEDLNELLEWTQNIVQQSTLAEIITQRLLRYREEHSEVTETIEFSQMLFKKDYDYETALELVQEKLKQIAPDELEEILTEYNQQQK